MYCIEVVNHYVEEKELIRMEKNVVKWWNALCEKSVQSKMRTIIIVIGYYYFIVLTQRWWFAFIKS